MNNKIFKVFKSKTIWFSVILMLFGFASDNMELLQGVITPAYYGLTVFVIGAVSAVLRFITTTAIEDK